MYKCNNINQRKGSYQFEGGTWKELKGGDHGETKKWKGCNSNLKCIKIIQNLKFSKNELKKMTQNN